MKAEEMMSIRDTMTNTGYPIIITTQRIQKRKHKKWRINKKWKKRYGFIDYEVQEQDCFIVDDKIYMKLGVYEQVIGMMHNRLRKRNKETVKVIEQKGNN